VKINVTVPRNRNWRWDAAGRRIELVDPTDGELRLVANQRLARRVERKLARLNRANLQAIADGDETAIAAVGTTKDVDDDES
jgi:hypothetical protein